jgi:hypothetical protein
MAGFLGVYRQGHLVGYFEAVAFEGYHFTRMVGQYADTAQSEIDQDLRSDAAFALHQTLAAQVMVEFFALVKADARKFGAVLLARIDLKSPAGVMQVNEDAAVGFSDGCERAVDDGAAIAGG